MKLSISSLHFCFQLVLSLLFDSSGFSLCHLLKALYIFVAFFRKVKFLFYWFLLLFFLLLVSTPSFIVSNLVFILCLNWSLFPLPIWGKDYSADFRVFSVSVQNHKLSFLPKWIAIKVLMLSVAIWFSSGYFPTSSWFLLQFQGMFILQILESYFFPFSVSNLTFLL